MCHFDKLLFLCFFKRSIRIPLSFSNWIYSNKRKQFIWWSSREIWRRIKAKHIRTLMLVNKNVKTKFAFHSWGSAVFRSLSSSISSFSSSPSKFHIPHTAPSCLSPSSLIDLLFQSSASPRRIHQMQQFILNRKYWKT